MFGKRKSELQKLREDYDKIVELLTRLCKSNSNSEPKQPEVTARQIINEWYYTEEELKQNGTVRE